MLVRNKWNKKNYSLVEVKEKSVVLKREDGSVFEIAKSEYYFSYIECA